MENIFTAFQPFLAISRILGFSPVSFVGPARRGNFKFKWINAVSPCILVLIYFIIIYYNTTNKFVDYESKVLYYAWALPSISEYIFQLFLILWKIKNTKQIIMFLKKLNDVDDKVS
jgi:hypothetical protein